MTNLEFIQHTCILVSEMSALALACGRLFITRKDRTYERSRWLLFAMMCLMAVHFIIQLAFRVRADNYYAGGLVNIIFFVPITMLMFLSMINLLDGGRIRKRHIVFTTASCAITWGMAIVGILVYRGLVLPRWYLNVLMGIFFVANLIAAMRQTKRLRAASHTLGRDLSNPASNLGTYVSIGAYVLYATSIVVPVSILNIRFLASLGIIMMPAFYFFAITFICLGSNMQGAMEALESASSEQADISTDASVEITPESVTCIKAAIERWRSAGGFADKELSIASFAKRTGIPQRIVTSYINKNEGCTFRSWITRIRVEEAKKLMKEKPNYCAEAIADECGFSSRSFFQTSFKNATGMTPREWLESQ